MCDICKKAFNQKNALNIHLKKHSGEKPHTCTYCNAAFTQRGNLKTHIKRAHHTDMVSSMNLPKSYMTTIQTGDSVGPNSGASVSETDTVVASVADNSTIVTTNVSSAVVGDFDLTDVADLL